MNKKVVIVPFTGIRENSRLAEIVEGGVVSKIRQRERLLTNRCHSWIRFPRRFS